MKYLLSLFLLLWVSAMHAQRTIVESLETHRAGEGVVTVHAESYITSLIGTRYAASAPKTLKARGFRVQDICRKQFARSTQRSKSDSREDKRNISGNAGIYVFPTSTLAVPCRRFQEHRRGTRSHAPTKSKRRIQRSSDCT